MATIKLNENERKVLEALDEATSGQGMCVAFDYLADEGRTIKDVRRGCRALRRKGLAEFHRGLMNDDGQVAGSGYCISIAGEAYLRPCDICGERATFDYEVDENGEWTITDGRRVLECDQHHKQSAKRAETKPLV